ncbi:MAG TPA: hypothetical protein VFA33_02005 [Bryobacteraceae bacterium]|nr:hypothetical protein [Bryobacteraceae bacterium]
MRALLIAAIAVSGLSPAGAALNPGEEQIKNLVVVVRSAFPRGARDLGAGIIFGAALHRLYILTANHVVRQGVETAQAVDVEFRWLPGERSGARLLSTADTGLDVAVLSVETAAPPGLLHFDRLGIPAGSTAATRFLAWGIRTASCGRPMSSLTPCPPRTASACTSSPASSARAIPEAPC